MARFLLSAALEVWRLLDGGVYSDLSINGEALIRGRRLFEVQRLLEEITCQCNRRENP